MMTDDRLCQGCGTYGPVLERGEARLCDGCVATLARGLPGSSQAEWLEVVHPWMETICATQLTDEVERWAAALAARLAVAGMRR